MATQLRPLGNNTVVEPIETEEITASGIVLPETAKEKPQQGVVTAVGPGQLRDDGTRDDVPVQVGDRVLYSKYAGTTFKIDGRELLILSTDDIMAIVL